MITTTVLLDLDNTLLGNSMEKFIPAYTLALEKRFEQQKLLNGLRLAETLFTSVQVSQSNQDPTVTNLDAFMDDFSQRLGVTQKALESGFELFYRDDFPDLKKYTGFRPAAPQLVEELYKGGYKVVIATNPLFTESPIRQRMAWAGVNDVAFDWITTMENSHFSKPDSHYYQEILDQVESTPETTWMVGDDLELDMAPAHQLGMKSWWITDHLENIPAEPPATCNKMGSLAQFLKLVQSQNL